MKMNVGDGLEVETRLRWRRALSTFDLRRGSVLSLSCGPPSGQLTQVSCRALGDASKGQKNASFHRILLRKYVQASYHVLLVSRRGWSIELSSTHARTRRAALAAFAQAGGGGEGQVTAEKSRDSVN